MFAGNDNTFNTSVQGRISKCSFSLEILKLSNCELTSNSAVKILSTQGINKTMALTELKTVDLSCNKLNDEATYPLIYCFLQMANLSEVLVDGNHFKMHNMTIIIDQIMAHKQFIPFIKYDDLPSVTAFLTLLTCAENISSEASKQIKNIIKTEILHLQCPEQQVALILTQNICSMITRFCCIKKLILYGIIFDANAIDTLAGALTYNLCRNTNSVALSA